MKWGKTIVSIFFPVIIAFLYPTLQDAIIDAGYTGTLAPLIEALPLAFLAISCVVPVVTFMREKQVG